MVLAATQWAQAIVHVVQELKLDKGVWVLVVLATVLYAWKKWCERKPKG